MYQALCMIPIYRLLQGTLHALLWHFRSSCIMPLSWCMMHDALCHHDAWWVSIKSQNFHKYFGLIDHTAVWIWWLWFNKCQIGPKVDNLEADPSHKKFISDFAHHCPQVQPVFWVTAHIFKAEKKYFGCRAPPEGLFLAPLIFFLVIFRSFFRFLAIFRGENSFYLIFKKKILQNLKHLKPNCIKN